jgi:hypothetical protein
MVKPVSSTELNTIQANYVQVMSSDRHKYVEWIHPLNGIPAFLFVNVM